MPVLPPFVPGTLRGAQEGARRRALHIAELKRKLAGFGSPGESGYEPGLEPDLVARVAEQCSMPENDAGWYDCFRRAMAVALHIARARRESASVLAGIRQRQAEEAQRASEAFERATRRGISSYRSSDPTRPSVRVPSAAMFKKPKLKFRKPVDIGPQPPDPEEEGISGAERRKRERALAEWAEKQEHEAYLEKFRRTGTPIDDGVPRQRLRGWGFTQFAPHTSHEESWRCMRGEGIRSDGSKCVDYVHGVVDELGRTVRQPMCRFQSDGVTPVAGSPWFCYSLEESRRWNRAEQEASDVRRRQAAIERDPMKSFEERSRQRLGRGPEFRFFGGSQV